MFGAKAQHPMVNIASAGGCGQPLPADWHEQSHPECLKADKRRRTQKSAS